LLANIHYFRQKNVSDLCSARFWATCRAVARETATLWPEGDLDAELMPEIASLVP
jgi:hypothetical protein